MQSRQDISEQYGKKELNKVRYYGWKIREGEALRMDITRKQERILSQQQKEAVTVGQASYYGWNFLQARYTDGHFGRGDNEKGLIIGARYWGLEIPASEVSGDGIS